jgi:deazaflavin-dependent oxidoreductase (nitroreductase family)
MSLQSEFIRFHRAIYERSGGRLGHRLIGVPALLLRTTGRRSGLVRVAVLPYGRDADGYVVVASNHGREQPPGWLTNIRAHPEVALQVGRRRSPALARIVEAADPDHPRLWALMNRANHGRYEGYVGSTSRPIPLVVVTPIPVRS